MHPTTKQFLDDMEGLDLDALHEAIDALREAVADILHDLSGARRLYLKVRREDPDGAGVAKQVHTKIPAAERELRDLEERAERLVDILDRQIDDAVAVTRRDLTDG